MDPLTSAWLFVIIGLVTAFWSGRSKNNVGAALGIMVLNVVNTAQLAYFTGLWPLYILSIISAIMFFLVVGAAAYLAIKDAKNA